MAKKKNEAASELAHTRWRKTPKAERAKIASEISHARWSKMSKAERSKAVPRSGGGFKPRKYPPCPRYSSHRFSPTTGRCPCGYVRAAGS